MSRTATSKVFLQQSASASLERSLRTLAEISELLSRVTTREEIAHNMTSRLRALLGADLSAVELQDSEEWLARYSEPPALPTLDTRVALPLMVDDKVTGGLRLMFAQPRAFSGFDHELLVTIAHQCAIALERARLFAEHAQNTESLTKLYAITASLSAALSKSEVARVICEHLIGTLGAVMTGVMEISEDRREFVLLHTLNWSDAQRTTLARFPIDTPLPVRDAVRNRTPVYLNDVAAWLDAGYATPPGGFTASPTGARVALPLLIADQVIGVVSLTYNRPHSFSPVERDFLMAIANQCAQAIDRARLYDAEHAARVAAEQFATRTGELYEAEHEARDRAEKANAAKSQFLGIMSHELRTPLNAVIGYADLLLMEVRGTLTADQKLQIERIRTSAWHQLGLIEEILAYARIEAGREEVRYARVNVRNIITETAELVRPDAQRKQLDLRVAMGPEDVIVQSDGAKLRQIMLNLAGNAVKFTDHGFVEVGLRRTPDEIICYAQDSGPGIATDKLELIWQPFTQVDQSDTRSVGGTGLGLAIVRKLAQLLGGKLNVQSVVGVGTIFEFKLPLHQSAN